MAEAARNPGGSAVAGVGGGVGAQTRCHSFLGFPSLRDPPFQYPRSTGEETEAGHCWDSHPGFPGLRCGVWGGWWRFDEPETTGQRNAVETGVRSQWEIETQDSSIYQRRGFGVETHHQPNPRRRNANPTLGGI